MAKPIPFESDDRSSTTPGTIAGRVPAPLLPSSAAADPSPGAALEREQAKERETER
jgi:hypothetical protein